MHTIIVAILKNEFGNAIKRDIAGNVWNIFPMHVPDGAINASFSKAIIYNMISNSVNYTANTYSIQLTACSKDYDTARSMANQIRDIFKSKFWNTGAVYPVTVTGLLSTTVESILDGGYDTDTGMYLVYVNIIAKGNV